MTSVVSKRSMLVTGTVTAAVLAVCATGMSSTPGATPHPTAIRWAAASGGVTSDVVLGAQRDVAYLALGTDNEVVQADVATTKITGTIADDAGQSVVVTPDDSTVYIADTGQYQVLAYDVSTRKSTRIKVGPYPQDVAMSPSGSVVYATVTGGDTGPGGSDKVAVISTATNTVTGYIRVGTAPRQVVFSPDGDYAYVTAQDGVYAIDVATSSVTGVFRPPSVNESAASRQGPQGIAVSADGKTLYVTYPADNSVRELDAATGAPLGTTTVGAEPYALTAVGTSLYVADMNADAVSVVSTATGKVTATIAVGKLPMSIAPTPDGTRIWVGNGLSGTISVISVPSGKVVATIATTAPGTSPLAIAFAQPPSPSPK